MLDPTKLKDWQIAEALEPNLKPIRKVAEEFGLQGSEAIPMGDYVAKVDTVPLFARIGECKAK